jgi:hypothetical protein
MDIDVLVLGDLREATDLLREFCNIIPPAAARSAVDDSATPAWSRPHRQPHLGQLPP